MKQNKGEKNISTQANNTMMKKKRREEEEEEKKKKKKREEEEVNPAAAQHQEEKKKKKREEEEVNPAAAQHQEEKKKKKKRREEEEVNPAAAQHQEEEEEKKKRREEEEEKKKKQKKSSTAAEGEQLDLRLVEEMQQFVPDIKNKCVCLRSGRCSHQENQRIRQNMADFLSLISVSSANLLLFPRRYKEQEVEIRKLRARHHFLERIAEGIPRPCHQVYIRARKMFDDRNYNGRFSKEEVHSLMKLQTLHGNDWSKIAEKMDRSTYSLQKRFAHIAAGRGAWSVEEEFRLKRALKAHLEALAGGPAGSEDSAASEGPSLTRDQLCNNLPWKETSQQVETRSWTQCRIKW
ncbi:hypothetical protein JOQ06_001176 [Pogonophryne albipinna]|uniref:Myb-like domain-containing protein n=1 Tax=Pogonophryne albipinna TaxID=1090488 RepID=A0AAD6B2A9_9TELE|nr:hypothetical protein JOQ06_001176 [Pogonophryne albipinna]